MQLREEWRRAQSGKKMLPDDWDSILEMIRKTFTYKNKAKEWRQKVGPGEAPVEMSRRNYKCNVCRFLHS